MAEEISTTNPESFDVVVVGAGPAGSIAAAELAKAQQRLVEAAKPAEAEKPAEVKTRWQKFTGKAATLDGDGRTWAEIAADLGVPE